MIPPYLGKFELLPVVVIGLRAAGSCILRTDQNHREVADPYSRVVNHFGKTDKGGRFGSNGR